MRSYGHSLMTLRGIWNVSGTNDKCSLFYICDTIKGNDSHVGNIQFWFFIINHLSILNATFWSKPHLNRTFGCRDMNILWSLKTIKNIRICHIFKPVTQNQYPRHPTHSSWSCHIYICLVLNVRSYFIALLISLNLKYQNQSLHKSDACIKG